MTLNPDQVNQQLDAAIQSVNAGKWQLAEPVYEKLCDYQTDDAVILFKIGGLALNLGHNQTALKYLTRAAELQPANPQYLFVLSAAFTNTGDHEHAKELLYKIIDSHPDLYNPYLRLGVYMSREGNNAEAVSLLQKALGINQTDPEIYINLIHALRQQRRHDDALRIADQLLAKYPNNAYYNTTKARILIEQGHINEALTLLVRAITLDKSCGIAYHTLASAKKFTADDKTLINQARQASELDMPDDQRSNVFFALGKIYDDLGEWDSAFEYYRQANEIIKIDTEPDDHIEPLTRQKDFFTGEIISKAHEIGSGSDAPIFIVGMPRSGTTLLEQIISSHPECAGAGEINGIYFIDNKMFSDKDFETVYKEYINRDAMHALADGYIDILRDGRYDSRHVVDKRPYNFMYLGLIYSLFPNAHVIHAVRNPLDTCLSCYFQAFLALRVSNDLMWLARLYRLYQQTMAHWKRLLPDNYMLDVNYEDVITHPEQTIRRVIEFCGLPWHEGCLEHHRAENVIITSSVQQARQPIYSSSNRRWQNYAAHIKALASELKDYLDEQDLAEFRRQGISI